MKKLIFTLLITTLLLFHAMSVIAQDDDMIIMDEDEFVEFDDDNSFAEFDDDGEYTDDDQSENLDDIVLVDYNYDDITIGNPTPLHGSFFTELWGNGTSDADVKHLVTGYNLVIWDTKESLFRFDNSVVSGMVAMDDDEGNRSYIISLYSDLYFSDGTPITAKNYVFSILLQASPLIRELDGNPAVFDYLVGYDEYASGETKYLAGVKAVTDRLLMLTVKAESLPYFYELSRIAFYPYPIETIAPGCDVLDDGDGAYIGNKNPYDPDPVFTAELLRQTIMDPDNGYLSHPSPVSGPYQLIHFDGTNAVFWINPFYKGNEEGKKPRITRLTYTLADNATMISELGEGRFALLNKVTYAPAIIEGLQLTIQQPQFTRSSYPRIGLTYILFNPYSPLIQETKTRQAIDYLLDTEGFIKSYVGQFGIEVDGLYGLGQWMTGAINGTIEYPADLPENATSQEIAEYEEGKEKWDSFSLDGMHLYPFDPDEAIRLLTETGWTLNEQGSSFDPETDQVRCKETDGTLSCLDLTMGYYFSNNLEKAFTEFLSVNLARAGIRLNFLPMDFDEILDKYTRLDLSEMDLLYVGDDFNISFDPSLFFRTYNADTAPVTGEDTLHSVYQEMTELALDMNATEPHAILEYMEKWIRFQERFSELLPLIPIYTNVYFDYYTRELDEYWIENEVSWGKAIVPARMRSLRAIDEASRVDLEVELAFASGEGELDLNSLIRREGHEGEDIGTGPLAKFPAYIREQVPDDYTSLDEFISASLNLEDTEDIDVLQLNYLFQTPYEEDETVYVLFGIPGKGSDVDWFAEDGVGQADTSISVILEREEWEKLLGHTFAVVVLSK